MSAIPFRHRAISHLRDRLDVQTKVLPESRIEDEHGNARFEAALVRTRAAASTLDLSALYALTAAAVVAFIGERPMSDAAQHGYRLAAVAIAVTGIALFFVAMWSRRRGRLPVLVELRGSDVVEPSVVQGVRDAAGDRAAWIVAARGFTKEALAIAERANVRCFASHGKTIAECRSVESSVEKAA